ncbi:hypothetical protein E2C01_098150 [Portunus trituberculatus]|uniref:Uncharacterized protein n=1 Tax=Portunus trituberculatus TaxID=210409 RepID=A0A5B7K0I9_PORTR|nr:hypothetical protein [Portunus trituberculatus]
MAFFLTITTQSPSLSPSPNTMYRYHFQHCLSFITIYIVLVDKLSNCYLVRLG